MGEGAGGGVRSPSLLYPKSPFPCCCSSTAGSSGTVLGSTGRNWELAKWLSMMPRPSMSPSRTPPTMALPSICLGPLRATMTAPAAAPDMIEFQGSSCLRDRLVLGSENSKPLPVQKDEKMSTVQPKILVYYRFERFEMINMYRTDQMASRLLKQITLTCRLKKTRMFN